MLFLNLLHLVWPMLGDSLGSVFGTRNRYALDFSGFSLKSGWDNVYDFGKRVAGLAAFVCVAAALFPVWSPSQIPLQYELQSELRQHTRQLRDLETVPTDVALIKQQMSVIDRRQLDTQNALDGLQSKAWMIIIGMMAWMGKEIFQFMGGKFTKGGNGP